METSTVDRLLGRLYTVFILRDATFLVSGGVVIATAISHPLDAMSGFLSTDTDVSWFALIIFLALSYVLGVLLQEGARWPLDFVARMYVKWRTKKTPSPDRSIVRMERVHEADVSEHTVHAIERLIFLRQIAATQTSTVIAVLAILVLREGHLYLSGPVWGAVVLFFIICVGTYLDKSRQLEEVFSQLLKDDPSVVPEM